MCLCCSNVWPVKQVGKKYWWIICCHTTDIEYDINHAIENEYAWKKCGNWNITKYFNNSNNNQNNNVDDIVDAIKYNFSCVSNGASLKSLCHCRHLP